MRIKSNIPQVAEAYFKKLEKDAQQAAVRAMRSTMIHGEGKAKRIIAAEAYDTGEGLRSVTHDITVRDSRVTGHLFAAAPHMWWVEHGRKPGSFPNLDAMTKWVGRKLKERGVNTRVNLTYEQLKALATTGGKKATAQQKAYREHLSALYLIGRSIATRGTKEKRIFARLEAELLSFYRAEVMAELKKLR
ncbi:MAG TPA: hypothetical protein VGN57_19005 [Pirellulaceae bacterium]|jgi:hypothetical protein|nr:hypothetical protein [Pirellulaceae bacterium]